MEFTRTRTQFSIAAILEYTVVCSVLAAFESSTGIVSCACLMAMALALAAKQGGLALATLIAASMLTEVGRSLPSAGGSLSRQLAVLLLAAALCVWYQLRTAFFEPTADLSQAN